MYPYGYRNPEEYYHRRPEDPQQHQQHDSEEQYRRNYYDSEEQHRRFPQPQHPNYCDSRSDHYGERFPPSYFPPMPPQFDPSLSHSGSMGHPEPYFPPMPPQFDPSLSHPEPYGGSFYPSMYPPPRPGLYPPVSSVGPFNPPARPHGYAPAQEYAHPSALEYSPAPRSSSFSNPPTQGYAHPSPSEYPPISHSSSSSSSSSNHFTQEYAHPSAHEYPPTSHTSSSFNHPTQEYAQPSAPEYPPTSPSYSPIKTPTQEDTHPSAPELYPSLHNLSLSPSTKEHAATSVLKRPLSARLSDDGLPKGDLVRIFCKANKSYNLAVQGDVMVMVTANLKDEAQLWIRDGKYGVRIKDNYGHPAFILVNKASKKVLKHAEGKQQHVQLLDYSPDMQDEDVEDVLWTESQDFGEGFKTVRMVSDTLLNMTVLHGDSKSGGIRHGSSVVLDTWHKKDNQLWKIFPL